MRQLNVMIADDDSASREVLKQFLKPLHQYKLCCEAADGEELIHLSASYQPDIIMLDIRMPNLDGIQAIKEIIKIVPGVKFIFITGYEEFAVEAFNLSAVDYIVKPVERARLYSALNKASNLVEAESRDKERAVSTKLRLKSRGSVSFIAFEDIIYVEKSERRALIHTKDSVFETTETLESLTGKLDGRFLAGHRSFIINLEYIENITPVDETYQVKFRHYSGTALISKHKISKIQKTIQNYVR